MSSSSSPCGACKLLRRKCTQGCVYFPPDNPAKFADVHRVFGASNVSKLLSELPQGTQRQLAALAAAMEVTREQQDLMMSQAAAYAPGSSAGATVADAVPYEGGFLFQQQQPSQAQTAVALTSIESSLSGDQALTELLSRQHQRRWSGNVVQDHLRSRVRRGGASPECRRRRCRGSPSRKVV
ncbi:hypothetical protein BAE44_0023448 [Dichanthelium oligosanthes]|uniref:LOB domain-containing protein n=1 Tax=Dichanthelium oligosanthes TaxID=888268 RepID=A0A1E5URT6_9POAL|nr:hypothetical protein BAE44_0023448 [Dichanthelium oligosanthes]